jgi:hypothetical protein
MLAVAALASWLQQRRSAIKTQGSTRPHETIIAETERCLVTNSKHVAFRSARPRAPAAGHAGPLHRARTSRSPSEYTLLLMRSWWTTSMKENDERLIFS